MDLRTIAAIRRMAIIACLSTVANACGSLGPARNASERAELRMAQTRWSTHHLDGYRYTITRLCECLPEWTRPVTVLVRGGIPESRVDAATGAALGPERAELFPTVEGLFRLIADALSREAASIEVDYDPALGYPTRISVDYDAQLADDEFVYLVSDFASLP